MFLKKSFTIWVLLLTLSAAAVPAAFAQYGPEQKKESAPKTGESRDAAKKPGTDVIPDELPLLNAEKIDEANKALGKKIDEVGRSTSHRIGGWLNTNAFWGITWLKLFFCLGLLLIVAVIETLFRHFVFSIAAKRAAGKDLTWRDLFLEALSRPFSLFIGVYGTYLALAPIWGYFDPPGGMGTIHRYAGRAADLGGTIAIFWLLYRVIKVVNFQLGRWAASTASRIDDMLVPILSRVLRVFVVLVGGIMVIQNMTGIELGPLIASLGIGGLAFALAAKDSIANFLGSLTILLDKPFQLGEYIKLDKYGGTVEGVGFRSTRLRTSEGNLVSVPNEKIINSTLENTGQRMYVHWNSHIALACNTPPEQVERAVEIIRNILANHEGMRKDYPPRVHFTEFKEWSLNIAVNTWYFPADYWMQQEWQQKTCLEIMRRLRDAGIEMAYPTQAILLPEAEKAKEPVSRADGSGG